MPNPFKHPLARLLGGEPYAKPTVRAEARQPGWFIQAGATAEFHRYLDLPAEIRDQIQGEIFEAARSSNKMSVLAAVSRYWQDMVEKKPFAKIAIDPTDAEDVSMFRQAFATQRRRGFMTDLSIIIDVGAAGPWYSTRGLSQISLIMEKLGHILQFINTWDVKNSCHGLILESHLHVKFVPKEGYTCRIPSLWDDSHLARATGSGELPANMPLWAIKSEFPAALGFSLMLEIPLDFVPLPASMALVQTMPNLTMCWFKVTLETDSTDGIERFADFISQLRALAPRLEYLHIRNDARACVSASAARSASMMRLSASLGDFSQRLKVLEVEGIPLHACFFGPPAGEAGGLLQGMPGPPRRWPALEQLKVTFGSLGPAAAGHAGGPGPAPAELFRAAARAAAAMPALYLVNLHVKDVPRARMAGSILISVIDRRGQATIYNFNKDDDPGFLDAFVPFMGGKASLVEENKFWKTRKYVTAQDSDGSLPSNR